jgi:phenylpropionate dioxygenase-like ring-hydroxylating dioxygenase large terminal subunit
MDRIFVRGWVFAAHESEIREPGDWITRQLGNESVIVVSDRDGSVNVMANRCSHHGTALCWEHRGNSTWFQCSYHAWTFGLDVEVRSIPFPSGYDRDKAELGLDAAGQIESYRGFVFVNLDGTAGPLSDRLGAAGFALIDRLCDLSPTGEIYLSKGWIAHRVQSNWKLWPESDSDGYHVGFVHASMSAATDSYYDDVAVGGEAVSKSRALDCGLGHIELDFRPSYQTELAWLGPTSEPLWPGEMIHRHTAVQFEGVDDRFNQRLLRQTEAAVGPASFITSDDAVTAERIQSGIGGTHSSWAAGCKGWIDLSRGQHRATRDEQGVLIAHLSDETSNRGFWRRYLEVMTEREPLVEVRP